MVSLVNDPAQTSQPVLMSGTGMFCAICTFKSLKALETVIVVLWPCDCVLCRAPKEGKVLLKQYSLMGFLVPSSRTLGNPKVLPTSLCHCTALQINPETSTVPGSCRSAGRESHSLPLLTWTYQVFLQHRSSILSCRDYCTQICFKEAEDIRAIQ